jgi:hypothetical protein
MDLWTLTLLAIFITFIYMVWNSAENKDPSSPSSQPQQQNMEQLLQQVKQLTEQVQQLQLQNQKLLRHQGQHTGQGPQQQQQQQQQQQVHQLEQQQQQQYFTVGFYNLIMSALKQSLKKFHTSLKILVKLTS